MREFVDRGDDDIREGNDNTVENFEAKMNGGDIICKGFNDDRKDNCLHCGKIFWSRVTGQIKCYTLRDTIEQHNLI